jgi:hypothetical protein
MQLPMIATLGIPAPSEGGRTTAVRARFSMSQGLVRQMGTGAFWCIIDMDGGAAHLSARSGRLSERSGRSFLADQRSSFSGHH